MEQVDLLKATIEAIIRQQYIIEVNAHLSTMLVAYIYRRILDMHIVSTEFGSIHIEGPTKAWLAGTRSECGHHFKLGVRSRH